MSTEQTVAIGHALAILRVAATGDDRVPEYLRKHAEQAAAALRAAFPADHDPMPAAAVERVLASVHTESSRPRA